MVLWIGNLFLVIIGCALGFSISLDILVDTLKDGQPIFTAAHIILLLSGPIGSSTLFLVRSLLRAWIKGWPIQDLAKRTYVRYDSFAFLPFGFAIFLGMGFRISIPNIYLLAFSLFFCQAACLLYGIQKSGKGKALFQSHGWLGFLFLVSGMAALIYEIIWQRMLFSVYGINIESVTIIVSLFMFGLGMGSLGGGILSRRYPNALPYLFIGSELAIGIFGVFSLHLMNATANRTFHLEMTGITLITYALLSLPTFFMGATLPILVTFLHRQNKHIGNAVSLLYFFNTLGSALACFITVDCLFVFFGRQATVWIAASLNLFAALSVLWMTLGKKNPLFVSQTNTSAPDAPTTSKTGFPFYLVLLIAALVGFLSLSQEILWVRIIGYNAQSAPQVFGEILGCFLLGIALGSWKSKKYCLDRIPPFRTLATLILFGSLLFYAALPITANLSLLGKGFSLVASYLLVGITAFLFGQILPILCHYGIRDESPVGIRISWIYIANIIGSTGGPMFMGFVLLDRYSLATNIRLVIWLGFLLALGIIWLSQHNYSSKWLWTLGIGICTVFSFVNHRHFFEHSLEKLHFGSKYSPERNYKFLVQNRSGILAVRSESRGDIIFGGGAYDGRFSIDPITNTNGIRRVFMLAALHPNPASVLEIGLSSGSWAKVILGLRLWKPIPKSKKSTLWKSILDMGN